MVTDIKTNRYKNNNLCKYKYNINILKLIKMC